MWYHYNTVNFSQNFHKKHQIARLIERDMGCLWCVQIMIDILPQSLQRYVQYHVILDCFITAPDCSYILSQNMVDESTYRRFMMMSSNGNIFHVHYIDIIMSPMASQITSLTIVFSTVYSGIDQTKHESSTSLAYVRGIHRGQVIGQLCGKCFHLMTSSCTGSLCGEFAGHWWIPLTKVSDTELWGFLWSAPE